jgi:Putative transposase/Transposase zinc-binding domain
MARPPLEVADLICAAGDAFLERNRHWLRWKHIKVLLAIRRCRTAALGGHLDECTRCGYRATISYTAAAIATARSVRPLLGTVGSLRVDENFSRPAICTWSSHSPSLGSTGATEQEGPLQSPVPHQCRNPSRSRSQSETPRCGNWLLQCVAYWSQKLSIHPHVHCVVPAGGLSPDHTRWVRSRDNYFLPKEVLREIFRGKFVDALE